MGAKGHASGISGGNRWFVGMVLFGWMPVRGATMVLLESGDWDTNWRTTNILCIEKSHTKDFG